MSNNNENSKRKVALFINYGTIKTIESLKKVLEIAKSYGKIIDAKMYFDQNEMEVNKPLAIEASKMGIEPIVAMLAKDVKMAIDFLDSAYRDSIDVVIIVHHQESMIPALKHANSLKRVILLVPLKHSKLFENVVDEIMEI